MEFTNAEKANAYGVGVYFLCLVCGIVSGLSLVLWGNMIIAVVSALFCLCLSAVWNHRKYQLMKDEIGLTLFRSVIFDTLLPSLGFICILCENKLGYLSLLSPIPLAVTMIPLILTNKKIQNIIVQAKKNKSG